MKSTVDFAVDVRDTESPPFVSYRREGLRGGSVAPTD